MYNHYQGNSGQVRRVDDSGQPGRPNYAARQHIQAFAAQEVPETPRPPSPPPRPVSAPPPVSRRPPSPLSGLSGELGRLLGKLSHINLETDDLLILVVLYLMYKESKDEELLFIMAAMFFL